jgi:exodeoxyribonuclease VII small subunit
MAEEKGFEAGLEALEALVGRLEGGELPLEEAMKRFEEGMLLSGKLSEKLEAARRKVEQLSRDKEGKPGLKAFADPAFPQAETEEDEEHVPESAARPASRKAGRKAGKHAEDSLF